ncbi:hypothetical protein EV13_2153 [Prochlorococcus sp. MIT 0702]|nr:hypothetical protein EV12_1877 [Prochlorococcus sp. MIT 0701]KGG27341.1 hypothetical protein EV13_2153 [Prochlorococcus sp. MIT 0702]KGG36217.1 hypothetical protein EV14_0627 [Prochlorococcus sp. MIT 0703]
MLLALALLISRLSMRLPQWHLVEALPYVASLFHGWKAPSRVDNCPLCILRLSLERPGAFTTAASALAGAFYWRFEPEP